MEIKKIKCKLCGQLKDGIVLKHYNLKICLECFPGFFKKRIQETIEKFKMFNKRDCLLVGISGGKDSMSATKALKDLGYNIYAIHINAEMGKISEESEKIVQNFCHKENIPLKIIKLKEEFKASLEELSRISRKPICAVCGMLRRYLLNRESEDSVIVTGHTLNDEVAFIFKNMLFWNDDLLSRIYPVLYEKNGLNRKVKPLCLITEEETVFFCNISNIKYVTRTCPYKSEIYEVFKNTVNEFNKKFPGSIIGFYKGFLKRMKNFYPEIDVILQRCEICGYPTTMKICNVCRLKEKLLQYKNG